MRPNRRLARKIAGKGFSHGGRIRPPVRTGAQASWWGKRTQNQKRLIVGGGALGMGGVMWGSNRSGRALDPAQGTPRGMYNF